MNQSYEALWLSNIGSKHVLYFMFTLYFIQSYLIQNTFELKQTLSYKKLSCTFKNFDPNVLLTFYVHPSPTHHLNPRGVQIVAGSF
jgi:hypothetical protein